MKQTKKFMRLKESGQMPPSSMLQTIHPEVMQSIDFLSEHFDNEIVRDFAWFLAENVTVDKISSFGERTFHGGLLGTINQNSSQGVYNPDEIPFEIYEKMARDPQIALGLALLTLPIIARPWSFECNDRKIQIFMHHIFEKHIRKILKYLLTSLKYGYSVNEKVFQRVNMKIEDIDEDGKKTVLFNGKVITYKKIKSLHPSSVNVMMDNKDNLNGFVQFTSKSPFIRIPKSKALWFANDNEFGNWYGKSRLKNIYKVWYWGELLQQFMLRYFERKGSPTTIVFAPPGESVDSSGNRVSNLDVAARIGRMVTENSVVTLPSAFKDGNKMWDMVHLQDDKRGEMFVEALNFIDVKKLRGLLIPERTLTQGESGSFSMASAHTDVFWLQEEGLISDLEDVVNEQLVEPILQLNFAPGEMTPCRYKIDELNWDRKTLVKDVLDKVFSYLSTVARQGKVPKSLPDISEMLKILEIPEGTFDSLLFDGIEPLQSNSDGDPKNNPDKPKGTSGAVGTGKKTSAQRAKKERKESKS